MKRSKSPDFPSASEAKRFDPFVSPPQFQQYSSQQQQKQQQQQQIQIQQQQQILAQQQMQVAAAAQQQQQQFQLQHQIQQPTQYGTNPPFFNQQAYFPMSPVNMTPFPTTAPPMMFNGSPSWNFMSTPPPFFTPTPSAANGSSQPPLPPPELKPEKPPLPREPEPPLGHPKKNDFLIRPGIGSPNYNAPSLRAPGSTAGLRIRGMNAMNGAMYNGFNAGPGAMRGPPPNRQQSMLSPNTGNGLNSPYGRNRRRNPHHFPPMNPHGPYPRMDFGYSGDYNEFNDDGQPAGPEKLTIIMNDAEKGQIQVNKKAKRKPMSSRYSSRSKEWVREDAQAALALEKEYSKASRRQMLILKFPDPDLNKYIVKKYSPFIETVHFQQPSTPRYCFVQLKEGADTEKVLEAIREIPFGTGKIVAEPKIQPAEDQVVTPEEIDPYTLYIGNLPTSISVKAVKMHFPNAQRIDIGYAQRMRYTRYAFIRYNSVEESMKAYKNTVNALLESRSLIVRFRRQKGNIGLPGETKAIPPQREDRENRPSLKPKSWDDADADADEDDYHEDDDGYMMDEMEEDDDDIILQEDEGLNSLRANGLAFAMVPPKEEEDKDEETADSQKTKTPKHETRRKQKEGMRASEAAKQLQNRDSTNNQKDGATSQPTTSVQATPSAASVSEESIDTKDNVLDKANQLLQITASAVAGTRPKSESPDCICVDPPETARKVRLDAVKVENSIDDNSSDSEGINLLGTRVKDEVTDVPEPLPPPTMDDIYLDDYEYDDMDGEPEEEDDDWADTSLSTRATNWEEIRRRELSAKEDKPDLNKLNQINNTLAAAAKVLPIVADLEPKSEFEKLYHKHQIHNIGDSIGGNDDLNDIFSEMNSDLEDDDDDQF